MAVTISTAFLLSICHFRQKTQGTTPVFQGAAPYEMGGNTGFRVDISPPSWPHLGYFCICSASEITSPSFPSLRAASKMAPSAGLFWRINSASGSSMYF